MPESALFNKHLKTYRLLAVLLFFSTFLCACGQTGPLKLPEERKQQETQNE